MSDVSSNSRSSRRNAQKQKQTITGFSKKMNLFAGGAVATMLVASAGIGLAMSNTSSVPLAKTPETSSKLYFQDTPPLDGWKVNNPAVLEGRGDLTTAQNPYQLFSPDGKCSYSRQVFHLPSYQSGRTDEFLTRQYLYEVAESNGVSGKDAQVVSVQTDKGKLDFLSTSYLLEKASVDSKKGDIATQQVYRSNAVRAIDKVVQIEGVEETKGLFGSDASQGIPVFFLSYQCETQADWNADTWKSLLDSTKLSLYSEEVPTQSNPVTQTSETPTPSATETAPAVPTPSATDATAAPTDSKSPDTAESTEGTP